MLAIIHNVPHGVPRGEPGCIRGLIVFVVFSVCTEVTMYFVWEGLTLTLRCFKCHPHSNVLCILFKPVQYGAECVHFMQQL